MTSTGLMRHHTADLLLCQTMPRLLDSRQHLNKQHRHSLLPHATTTSLLLIQTRREGMVPPRSMARVALMLAGATLVTAGHMRMPGLLQLPAGRTLPAPMPSHFRHSLPQRQKLKKLPIELEAQMKAREEAKKKERADRLQEDLKVHREAARYDPWGRGGGGAPHQSPTGQPISDLQQMHGQSQQQAPSQNAASQQRSSEFYANNDQYNRQSVPQQQPPSGYQQDPYANPQRQLSDPRLYQPPPGHQRPAAPGDRVGPYPDRGGPSDQQYSGGSYGQPPTGRRGPEPSGTAQQSMPNDGQGPEFGMGRRGAGEYGRGQGPNLSRGQTPPPAQGTGAASVLGLGQNKLPQRAEVYFRSDKANMQPEEIAAKQQQASELQDELKKQIEAKKRVKEEQQRKEKEEDAREQARLQGEQQKLKQQFAEEKEAEKAKRALESGASQQVQQAWANVKGKEPLNKHASNLASSNSNAADHLQRQPDSSNSDPAHRSANNTERQQSRRDSRDIIPANAQGHNAEQRGSGNSGGGSFAGQSGFGQLQGSLNGGQLAAALSAGAQQGLNASSSQMPFAGEALAGLAEAANGSAMLAARQAAAAQLDQFRAEMVAEAAKMRAAVERQQAEVAELNRRAQHAEQESTAARAEAAAVRQAAAQQQAERAIAQYAQANRHTRLPFQDAQTAREYEPLPDLGLSRPRSHASHYSGAEPPMPTGLAMWSATNPGDYGASLRDSAVFRRPPSSGSSALDRLGSGLGGGWQPALDSGLDQSMAAETTLIYPKGRPAAPPASLRQSAGSHRPEGAPAAEASHPGDEEGDGELQAEAIAVPLRGQGGAATPLTDVGMLFAQNQNKLKALKLLEEQAASGNAEALDEFLQKYAGSRAQLDRSSNGNIPAQYSQQDLDLTAGERSITSSVRWMNAF
ncbi:TPA: Centrosome and spindle, variant 2 [Trebouxia sp. C0006]